MAAPWSHLALWQSQRDALRLCATYFDNPSKSALVQMPTGAGKTGVIAVVAVARAPLGPVLVLSPSEALVAQLMNELRERFWQTINAPQTWRPDAVQLLLPRMEAQIRQLMNAQGARQILVGTFQALWQIAEKKRAMYDLLKRSVSTVLTDEGHREPAPEWAQVVRRLRKPTVLFSATPYRNDQKVFDVSEDAVHYLSFVKAVNKFYVRDVEFVNLTAPRGHAAFAEAVVRRVDRLAQQHRIATDCKIIVRAGDQATVTALHNAFRQVLQGRPDGVLAFHEEFDASVPTRLSSVPDLRARSERYLIHQFKLNEGVDEPRCGVFVPYDDFGNARNLVQQVGRIIRNPTPLNRPRHSGIVLLPSWSKAADLWNDYRQYDTVCEGLRGPVIRTRRLVDQYLDVLPAMEYVGRGFRKKVNFSSPDLFDQVAVPKSCVVYELKPSASWAELVLEIKDLVEANDRLVVAERESARDSSYVMVSIEIKDSDYLAKSFFPEFALQVTMVRVIGRRLFLADTEAIRLELPSPFVEASLSPDLLTRLFPQDAHTRINRIAARNSDIGGNAIRARAISARSLEDAAPFMGDHLHMVSHVRGRTRFSSGRYVGLTTSRVREEHSACTIEEFRDWTDAINSELNSGRRPAKYLARFATPSSAPPDATARNILLDIGAVEGMFVSDAGLSPDDIDELCSEVTPDPATSNRGTFTINVDGQPKTALIKYDPSAKRYKIESEDLEQLTDSNRPHITLLSRINQKQSFRVLCESRRYIYSSGSFYRIDGQYGLSAVRSAVLNLMVPINDLVPINDEKGSGVGNGNWSAGSLFRYINDGLITAGSELEGAFERVVCDDLTDEIADFVAIRGDVNAGKVVFVHGKVGGGSPGAGASGLYEVCSQATKNLVYLRYGAELPNKERKWNGDWHRGQYRVATRIRAGGGDAAVVRDAAQALLDRPTTTREMWLVLGGTLSKGDLEARLNAAQPEYFAVQTAYLLMSADAACKSVGVGFRVFCAP